MAKLGKYEHNFGTMGARGKYLSKINYTYLTTSCLLPLASCLLPIFTRKLILHDYLWIRQLVSRTLDLL